LWASSLNETKGFPSTLLQRGERTTSAGFSQRPRPPLTRYAMPNPASADAIPMIAICVPLRPGRPIVVLAFHQPIAKRASVLTTRDTAAPRRIRAEEHTSELQARFDLVFR